MWISWIHSKLCISEISTLLCNHIQNLQKSVEFLWISVKSLQTQTISILDYCFILTIITLFCITSLLLYFLIIITNINYIIITTFSIIFMTIFVFLCYITVPHNHVILFHYCASNFLSINNEKNKIINIYYFNFENILVSSGGFEITLTVMSVML